MDNQAIALLSSNSIRIFLAHILEIDSSIVREDAGIYRTQNWDSLAQMEIVIGLEDQLCTHIPDETIEQLTTLSGIENYIITISEKSS